MLPNEYGERTGECEESVKSLADGHVATESHNLKNYMYRLKKEKIALKVCSLIKQVAKIKLISLYNRATF